MRLFVFFTLFLTSFFSFASYKTFKPIGSPPKYYTPAGSVGSTAARMKAAITVNGKFAFATFKPATALSLGRQLAKKSPYALVALAALDFFQDENNEWRSPALKSGDMPYSSPDFNTEWAGTCNSSGFSSTISGNGDLPSILEFKSICALNLVSDVTLSVKSGHTCGDCTFDGSYNISTNSIEIKVHLEGFGGLRSVFRNVGGTPVSLGIIKSCPPSSSPDSTHPLFGSDGEINNCVKPQDFEDYTPQQSANVSMAEVLANDQIQKEPIWDAFKDHSNDINLSPESIESYNQPNVSPVFNDYLKSVASNNHQTSNTNMPNYVPADMVAPTQAAISSLQKGNPFLDPTTNDLSNPNEISDGAASKPVDPNAPVTNQNITVNVEIPEDDTISQTEYEQSNDMYFNQFNDAAQLELVKIDNNVNDLQQSETDFITSLTDDVTNFDVPDFPTFASLFPDLPLGTCTGFSLNTSVGGVQRMITFDKHCPPYNQYIHPLLLWLFYVLTGLYVFNLASETLKGN